jgi:hypothetical protein
MLGQWAQFTDDVRDCGSDKLNVIVVMSPQELVTVSAHESSSYTILYRGFYYSHWEGFLVRDVRVRLQTRQIGIYRYVLSVHHINESTKLVER